MPGSRSTRLQYHCSFCGKNQDQVKRLIAGPGAVYICDECVELCREIIHEEASGPGKPKARVSVFLHLAVIDEQLSEYVIGQEQAKKVLSVAVYNHYKRINAGGPVMTSISRRAISFSSARPVPARHCSPRRSRGSWTCRSASPTPRH